MEKKPTRNATATRERILAAATTEFSAFGIAGARVDRIAGAARCNKNLIYVYFHDKQTLFNTVLHRHLARIYEAAPFDVDDLPGYATKVLDFSLANPELMRLMAWATLEGEGPSSTARRASGKKKIAALVKAQRAGQIGDAFPPGFLLVALLALANAWSDASWYGDTLDPAARKHPTALKRHLAEAVQLLVTASSR